MNIHEYQAKEILKTNGVSVPYGIMTETIENTAEIAIKIQEATGTDAWAVKAQIHAGGRGKGGGVKIAKSINEVKTYASDILGMQLITKQTGSEGKKVHKLLIEQGIYYPGKSPIKEFYMSILLNRNTGKNMIMYSTEGGMDIETVAENTPHLIFKEEIEPGTDVLPFQARRIAFNLQLSGKANKEMQKFVMALYKAYKASYANMFEINPVIKTSDDMIMAADAKVTLDDHALYLNPEYNTYRDITEEDTTEAEAKKYHLNYVKLDGNVGCMVNGAGLAMATMDIIKLANGNPANFLDVGGGANAETVEKGFRLIMKDPNVKAILINIFGGIVRCDRVAKGIVEAYKNIGNINIPIIVRLQGTNAEEAKEIIDKSGLQVKSAILFKEAAELVKKELDA